MIKIKQKGDFRKVTTYLTKVKESIKLEDLERYGEQGVMALKSATPINTGLTASSWDYIIERKKNSITISFINSNIQNGVPIAIILQYGHATRNGGFVQGRDYINPAIQPVFDKLAEHAWEEVSRK